MHVDELTTPALLIDAARLEANLATMSRALPGPRLRPHVKAHKCTALARRQLAHGHQLFCCATLREMEGMVAVGLDADLLLANESVDGARLRRLADTSGGITIAVDSERTIAVAAEAGIRSVLIDVNVGLPRCGCAVEEAGGLADLARRRGLEVRGVMGYEGHVVGLPEAEARAAGCEKSMLQLLEAHAAVGGEVISAGGTGTYALNTWATEIQAGSYALMDTAYRKLGLPFVQAVTVLATVISVAPKFSVADCGLKALGMDHGNPEIENAKVWFCSDEHVTFAPESGVAVGDRIRVIPAHVDPTLAYHEQAWLVEGDRVVERWPIDLRGW